MTSDEATLLKVDLTYGDSKVEIDIPDENLSGKIVPKELAAKADMENELARVLANPHGPHLADVVKGRSVCVLIADHTRDAPHGELANAVAPLLVDANRVLFVITTGSHEVEHPGNLEIVNMLTHTANDAGLEPYKIAIHDCQASETVHLGQTTRGTPLLVNAVAVGYDVYVPLSDMKAHYFAGYSNPLKDFLPGICAFRTIEANHSMALNPKSTFGRHPFHPDESRRDNPLADDMREATEIITRNARVFTLAVISSGSRLVWADAGRLEPVIARGIEVLDETASFTVKSVSRIVVSPGGYPQDKSLYHAQRGLELTKNAVTDKGEILFLAECRDGVAPPAAMENFYDRLKAPLDDVLRSISGKYHLYEHKAFKFAELLKRVSGIKMYTQLDRNTVESAHLEKVEDPQQVVDQWISEDPETQILVLDKGNKLAVYAS
ncbi:MAG: lactate racemase domain-containing protein [Candidatus Thorarchaeota archaeon]